MGRKSAKVTIVIPCYNQVEWLPDAIESALAQTEPCDVIVVDDHSTEDVYDVVRRYKNIGCVIHGENRGLSAARNSGIDMATTEWILPLDADDKIDPTMVERCLQVNADIVGVGQETFGDYVIRHIFDKRPKPEDFITANRINCSSMFRKSMWEALGGYDEDMRLGYEDWDFWLRATQAGFTVETIQEPLFFYRKHGTSMVNVAINNHDLILEYMFKKLVLSRKKV